MIEFQDFLLEKDYTANSTFSFYMIINLVKEYEERKTKEYKEELKKTLDDLEK